jgi:hypothetical protein
MASPRQDRGRFRRLDIKATRYASYPLPVRSLQMPIFPNPWWKSHNLSVRANCFLAFEIPQAEAWKLGHSSQGKTALSHYVV